LTFLKLTIKNSLDPAHVDQSLAKAVQNPAEVDQNRQLKRSLVQEAEATLKSPAHAAVILIAAEARRRTETKETSEIEVEATRLKIREDQDHGNLIFF
jgi:hypothetical protein